MILEIKQYNIWNGCIYNFELAEPVNFEVSFIYLLPTFAGM